MSPAHPINEPTAVRSRHTVALTSRAGEHPEGSAAPPARQAEGPGTPPVPDRSACANRWCTVIF